MLATVSNAARSTGRRREAIASGRLMPKPDGERGDAHQHVAAEVIGQSRESLGKAGVSYHGRDDGTRRGPGETAFPAAKPRPTPWSGLKNTACRPPPP